MRQTHQIEGFLSGIVKQFTARPDTVISELGRLRAIRRRTLTMIAPLSETQAAFSPRVGAWSVVQILDHIVLFEGLYRDAIEKLMSLARQGRKTEIRYSLTDIDVSVSALPKAALAALEVPLDFANQFIPSVVRQTIIRFPVLAANTPKVAEPRPGLNIVNLREQLASAMVQTSDLLSGQLPGDPLKMKISHPVLGINNVIDLLGLMAAHEERHQDQIRNILADPRLPKAVA